MITAPMLPFRLLTSNVVWLAALFNLIFAAASPAGRAEPPSLEDRPVNIVAYGDSLTAGYRLKPNDSFPAQLSQALAAKGYRVEIQNAGVSGDTSASGLERFDWAVPDGTEAVILELGANDALRGIDPAITRRNLDAIVTRLKARNIEVLIAGMKALKNWGPEYATQFDAIYPGLAQAHDALLYPFFLEGVALDPALNLDDGLHPNARGIGRIVEQILPSTEALIERVKARRSAAAPAKT